jgi:glycosyltransferase involved in cell wall biosynthesis
VIFVDAAPAGTIRKPVKALTNLRNLTWHTQTYATRLTTPLRLAFDRLRQKLAQLIFRVSGVIVPEALSARVIGLERILEQAAADVYLGHYIETLLPVCRVSHRRGALLMFDSMEFYSQMGDSQTFVEQELIRTIERKCLPNCVLVLASSDQLADALVDEYGIARPLPLYNVPPVESELPPKTQSNFALYWRNAVVGLGQRGLDEALVALTKLPNDISLHLQGKMAMDGGRAVKCRIAQLSLEQRVIFHDPYLPEEAVKQAAKYHIGLCLERRGVRNQELTVSNKIFDYHMAGLAVVASDLPGLRSVIKRSCAGLLFQPGSATDLATKISTLYNDRPLLDRLAMNAREFALREANREIENKRFTTAFRDICRQRLQAEV